MNAYQFFYRHAGYSYDPKTQTKAEGRRECAKTLARAERLAFKAGVSFQWTEDPYGADSAGEFSSSGPFWQCVARDASGVICASVGGVDFGDGGVPWGDTYSRVIQAELSLEASVIR